MKLIFTYMSYPAEEYMYQANSSNCWENTKASTSTTTLIGKWFVQYTSSGQFKMLNLIIYKHTLISCQFSSNFWSPVTLVKICKALSGEIFKYWYNLWIHKHQTTMDNIINIASKLVIHLNRCEKIKLTLLQLTARLKYNININAFIWRHTPLIVRGALQ